MPRSSKRQQEETATASRLTQDAPTSKGRVLSPPAYEVGLADGPVIRRKKKEDEELKKKLPIQAKLKMGRADDKYEREADAIAEKVVRGNPEDFPLANQITPLDGVSRESGFQTVPASVEKQISASKGGGVPLPEHTRLQMEEAFGVDFSGIKIHASSEAVQMNQEIGAKAFTLGRDLFFNKSHYKPEASKGKWLLGHELGHFVQQEKYQLNNEKEPSNRWGIQRKKKKSEEKETYSLEECPWTCEDCNKWEEEDLAAKRNANPKIIKAIKQEYKNCRSYCEGGWQKYDIPTHLKKHKEFWRIFSSMIHTTYVVGTTIKDKDKKEAYLSKRKKEIWKYLDRTMTNKAFWRAGIRGYK